MRNIIFFLLFTFNSTVCLAQDQKGYIDPAGLQVPQQHYLPEFTFDVPSDPDAWAVKQEGLHAGFGSTDELYFRCEVPVATTTSWEKTGWRGERLNAQIAIWSHDTIEQVRLKVSDFTGTDGKTISAENITTSLVRYVVSNYSYGAAANNCDSRLDSAWLMPDRFEPFDRFDLPGNSVRPVWITIDIPREASPGVYYGTIEVNSKDGSQKLEMTLTVERQILPDPTEWKFRLDLWQNPWVVSNYYNVIPWSAEHIMLLKKHLKLYADAGGKYITTYAVYSPWSDNSYMIEGTMIDWVKKTDGTWKFDYSIFDQYVQLCMETGIKEAITVYTPVPWGRRFRYMDDKTGNYIWTEWTPGSKDYRDFWNVFLDDLKAHLTQKGWFEKTYLGINENPLEITLSAIKVIKDHSKDWKITYAGDWHEELESVLDDYSTVISHEAPMEKIKNRSEKKLTTTFYVCCTPPRPNNFVFSPPVEGRYLGWYAMATGYDGFLRWAYDAWTADPMRDTRHTYWPAGDCFLVYPGANSGIRFEKLKEGIRDFEKIRILREQAAKSQNSEVKKLMQDLERHLSSFLSDPDYDKRVYDTETMTQQINDGNQLIIRISDLLSK